MSSGTIALLAVIGLAVLAAVVILAGARRRDADQATGHLSRETVKKDAPADVYEGSTSGEELERQVALMRRTGTTDLVEPSGDTELVPFVPPDEEAYGVTRRQFLNRSNILFMGLGLGAFGTAIVGFLWGPEQSGGFGSAIEVGKVPDVIAEIKANNGFLYRPDGRMWLTEYPSSSLDAARQVYSEAELNGMEAGVTAIYQKCPHLGCRVPECASSQWFECPCHGSQYNQVGEKKGGPAPRGMDHFGMNVDAAGTVTVDTGLIIPGAPIGTNTTGQEAEGPNCIGQASEGHGGG